MSSISTTPLHISISDFQDIDRSIASISGVILEARSYQKALNPKGNEVYGAAYPIPNAPVYLADSEDGYYLAAGLTDNSGCFTLHNIPNGLYCLKTDHAGTTMCDEKTKLRIDNEVEHLDIKAIISDYGMITRVKINPYLKNRSAVSEALKIELPPEPNGKMKLRVNMSICRIKIEISELTKGIILSRDFENIPSGYEAVLELNHLDPGAYIMQISCDDNTLSKQLILQ